MQGRFCKYCVLEKPCKVSFDLMNKENRAKEILDYIHSIVWGSALIRSYGGALYFVSFMREKSKVSAKFRFTSCGKNPKSLQIQKVNQTGRKIKYLLSENVSDIAMEGP